MQDKQDKKKKTNIKLNDLKPKKDAKGGVAINRPGRGDGRSSQGHQIQRRGDG